MTETGKAVNYQQLCEATDKSVFLARTPHLYGVVLMLDMGFSTLSVAMSWQSMQSLTN